MDWIALQLADASFPTGGFAHSGGLEAALQAGALETRRARALPRRRALAGRAPDAAVRGARAHAPGPPRRVEFVALDAAHDAALRSPVANRASRSQGRAHLDACVRAFGGQALHELREAARAARSPRHLAPVLGASLARARRGARRRAAAAPARDGSRRRLGRGAPRPRRPRRGAAPAGRAAATQRAVLAECAGLEPAAQCQTAPLLDLLGAGHDRLYSRLFTS